MSSTYWAIEESLIPKRQNTSGVDIMEVVMVNVDMIQLYLHRGIEAAASSCPLSHAQQWRMGGLKRRRRKKEKLKVPIPTTPVYGSHLFGLYRTIWKNFSQ